MKGSEHIEIRTPPVVQVSLHIAINVDDFFNLGSLIQNLAFVLGFNPSQVRVVEVIAEDKEPLARRRRSIPTASVYNLTTITFELGNPPVENISTPETTSVAEEVAMVGGSNYSVVWTIILG